MSILIAAVFLATLFIAGVLIRPIMWTRPG